MTRELRFDDRMPDWLHVGLVNHLQFTMHPDDCQGDYDRTRAFLTAHAVDVPNALAWLTDHGAYCDCQVVLNTHPTLGETRH